MPAVRRRRALAVAVATAGLVAAATLLAAPAMADGHGHGHSHGGSSAGASHPGHEHGAGRHHGHEAAPTATQHGVAGPGSPRSTAALRHDIVATAVRTAGGPGRSARAHQRGRARAAQVAHRHGRHAVVTSPGAGKGQQPDVRTGPATTPPAVHPVTAARPVTAPERAAERIVVSHRPVVVAQRPPVVGDGGVRVSPPLQNIVQELGNVARFSLFGGPVGWAMSGVLLVALVMMGAAFAVGRRRGASRSSAG